MTRAHATLLLLLTIPAATPAAEPDWKHNGSIWLLTTPDGANLPAAAAVDNFPVLVRLHKDFFNFADALPDGRDIRFFAADGTPLAHDIDEWDAPAGTAAVWVRVPRIKGNDRQELKIRWGNLAAKSESNATAVFNESNGYVSVWHMGGRVADALGTVESKDTGTTPTPGLVGGGRHFPGQKGVFCGEKIPNYPSAASSHSTEAWVRAEKPNTTIIGWGNEAGGRGSKVRMQLRSPPHVHVDSNFSDVDAPGRIPLGEWFHVVHTYDREDGRVYINGKLDGAAKPLLNIKSPARLWLGGWFHNYDFVGDLDEVRVSKVARSADWVKLQFENQKPLQTLVGPVVQAGNEFSVPETALAVPEGKSVTLTAKAGGAQKIYWTVTRDGKETVAAADRLAFTFAAGRVVGDQKAVVQLKAVFADGVKTKDIPVTVKEDVPEPAFTLHAPAEWDGRTPIEVVPRVSNLAEMRAKGADTLTYKWTAGDIAVIKNVTPGKLTLTRAQNSGPLTFTLAVHNGGRETVRSATITVKEPATDPWVNRMPAKDETPVDGQFYARDDANEGTLFYNGTLPDAADAVTLKLFADGKLVTTLTQKPGADKSYAFTVKLKSGLVKYSVELGSKTGDRETVLRTVGNLVCGDAFLITGQSNAVATDFGKDDPEFRSEWVRTFGSMSGSPKGMSVWGNAVHRSRDAEKLQIGYWGMELGRRLVEANKIPVFLINGAVGGTRIDQHQRNPADPEDMTTIYGRLLWRVKQAKLTHGIRGVLWHQGENDQGADGPTGGYGWETYRQLFIDLAAAWKQDFPNIKRYYVFQIWPKSCAMGINGSDNRLREVQRTLPTAFSNLSVMSTLGIDPPGGCHFPAAGYAEFARLIAPLVERDHYGKAPATSITPPNLNRVYYSSEKGDEVVLEFDQPVNWDDTLKGQFYLDGEKGRVVSGRGANSQIVLKLTAGTTAKTLTYLDSKSWSQAALLRGENCLAALTFCEVPILRPRP